MKILKYIVPIAIAFVAVSCGEDFLDRKNLYQKGVDNYYTSPKNIAEALAGAYACLPIDAGANNPILIANLQSDHCFGGGGPNDLLFHDISAFTNLAGEDLFADIWELNYQGILRVNLIIENFDKVEYPSAADRDRDLGEAHFLRAYFYFRLAQLFGTVPLLIKPEPVIIPRATHAELYNQIASDLKRAIELLPNTPFPSIPKARLGHATKWAAQGLMARVFLFYTGYYKATELPNGVSKQNVIDWLDDCIANSGHDLISDFRNLWPYSYATAANNQDSSAYPFADINGLSWIGEQGANVETVFAIRYSPYGDWNLPGKLSYSNQLALYMALRGQDNLIPYGTGWGGGPVNPQLWNSWPDNDLRKRGSILDVTDPLEGNVSTNYVWGVWECMHETGLWQKKYTPIQVRGADGIKGMYFYIFGSPDNFQIWNMQDEYIIRFADILLMGAELGGPNAKTYLDRVRARVNLPSVDPTLENIKLERTYELAFEGLRYYDLLRWGDAEAAFALVKDVPVKNALLDETYTIIFRPETGGFLPIPESEIRLSAGVITQTPGW